MHTRRGALWRVDKIAIVIARRGEIASICLPVNIEQFRYVQVQTVHAYCNIAGLLICNK